MAITFAENVVDSNAATTTTVSGTLTVLSTSVITVTIELEDNATAGTLSISNSGTALTWNNIGSTNTVDNCKVQGWWAFGDANGNRTVTVTRSASTATNRRLSCIVNEGANQTTPIPSGKVLSGVGATDLSLSMTPTNADGSALWLYAADWNQTGSFAALANCSLVWVQNVGSAYTGTLVSPTTQPRTDGSAFTIGETDTSGKLAYLAFEVVAAGAGGGGSIPRKLALLGVG